MRSDRVQTAFAPHDTGGRADVDPPRLSSGVETGDRDNLSITPIDSWDDPRLDDYRDIRDRDLLGEAGRPGLFIGEQWLTVEKMLSHPGLTKSVLMTPGGVKRLGNVNTRKRQEVKTGQRVSVYVISEDLMERVAGFRVHRGVLAVGYRPAAERLTIDAVVPHREEASRVLTVLLCEDITNIDNIGGLFRNAAAFGVDAVVLSPKCHDPLYRKSIRVSIGHVLSMPWARSRDWAADLERLKAEWGLTLIAAATGDRARPLDSIEPPARVGLIVGPEFDGLGHQALDLCDHVARVPMSTGVDSLNVTVAAAVCLHRFSRGERA